MPNLPSPTHRNPVVLIHGLDDTAAKFQALKPFLARQGWAVHDLTLTPSNGSVGLEHLAQQVFHYIEATFAPDQPIDLVGFSMGGIVSRYYVQRLGGLQRTHRLVTIASPHNGTWVAYLRPNIGAAQMRRQSAFLSELNRDVERLNQINVTSIWTPYDLMIVPAQSSQLPIGKEIQLPVLNHSWMVYDPRSLGAIATALAEPLRSLAKASQG